MESEETPLARYTPPPEPPRSRAGFLEQLWASFGGALLLFLCAGWCLGGAPSFGLLERMDKAAGEYYKSTMMQATTAYALSAAVNGAVSVVKESEVAIKPIGMGMSFKYGQILDPIDDAIEQLSSLLSYVIVGLTTLRVVHWILTDVGMGWVGWLLVIAGVLTLVPDLGASKMAGRISGAVERVQLWVLRVAVLLLGARLMLPTAALISEDLDEKFFQPKYEAAMAPLRDLEKMEAQARARHMPTLSIDDGDTSWVRYPKRLFQKLVVEPWNYLKFRMTSTYRMWSTVWSRRGEFIQSLVDMSTLYATSFLLNVLLLPTLLLLGFNQLVNTLFDLNNAGLRDLAENIQQTVNAATRADRRKGGEETA